MEGVNIVFSKDDLVILDEFKFDIQPYLSSLTSVI